MGKKRAKKAERESTPTSRRKARHQVRLFQLKATLLGTKPSIWRRILLRDDFSLSDLHHVLQISFGWQNAHLHQWFLPADGKLTRQSLGIARVFAPPDFELDDTEDADAMPLSASFAQPQHSILYQYDMGDSWEHEVRLESVIDFDGKTDAVCIAGERAGPPEDVGGVAGFYDRLDALRDANHPEHADTLDWFGDDWYETALDLDAINRTVAKAIR